MWCLYKIVKQNVGKLWGAFLKCHMYVYIYMYIVTLPLKTKSIYKWSAKWLGVWLYLFKSASARRLIISGISISYLQM